jgi:hypothetical protein
MSIEFQHPGMKVHISDGFKSLEDRKNDDVIIVDRFWRPRRKPLPETILRAARYVKEESPPKVVRRHSFAPHPSLFPSSSSSWPWLPHRFPRRYLTNTVTPNYLHEWAVENQCLDFKAQAILPWGFPCSRVRLYDDLNLPVRPNRLLQEGTASFVVSRRRASTSVPQ